MNLQRFKATLCRSNKFLIIQKNEDLEAKHFINFQRLLLSHSISDKISNKFSDKINDFIALEGKLLN